MRPTAKKSRPGRASDNSRYKVSDASQAFLHIRMLTYMDRLLAVNQSLNRDGFMVIYRILGHELAMNLLESVATLIPKTKRPTLIELEKKIDDGWDYSTTYRDVVKLVPKRPKRLAETEIRRVLGVKLNGLAYKGGSAIENSIEAFRRMFSLDDTEIELCVFLFMMSSYKYFSDFFGDELECHGYRGRTLLATILECTEADIARVANGKLYQIGIIEKQSGGSIAMEPNFARLLQDFDPRNLKTEFFRQVQPSGSIPLSFHLVDKDSTRHILDQLRHKPETSTHILLYGPPGTGKTSYAYGLAKKLGLNVYLVDHGDKEDAVQRRVAITACVNMARESDGSMILADDSDSILNTENSWSNFGERSDKRWLHDILETPGVRMLWTVNSIEHLEESVVRRFAFSLQFKPFNRRQRMQVWQNSIKTHKVGRFFKGKDIESLAARFDASPGVIDQVLRKARESRRHACVDFKSSVILALEAHTRLRNGGYQPKNEHVSDRNFTLDGLNLTGADARGLLEELSAFNNSFLNANRVGPASVSLLFHGPPGSGKSALAKHIAVHLDKEIVVKRASDLFSKWVGETEQNIRNAYEEAQSKEAVLIFDEADSLIFNRDRAEHAWELSFTNEFLTWMESFQGIQIFTTNRLKDLDSASLRRFSRKVEFGYLRPEGNVIFYDRFMAPLVGKPADSAIVAELKRMSSLAPGDFKVVRDRFALRNRAEVSHREILDALKEEARLKDMHSGVKNIGFV